jgi:hypothetical protein
MWRLFYVVVFGSLALLAATCPCDKIYDCHKGIATTLAVGGTAAIVLTL